jgi:regulatory protein
VSPEDPWHGDVSAGVDAWTQRASTPTPAGPPVPPPPDPVADGPEADHEAVARKILLD